MGNIVLLDDLTINQIAAGEVIERPASVVKEMLENSIDAGAKNITIEIKNGGISLIRITDDGVGIAPDDMEIAFERHATSKIRSSGDLKTIKTMGFRGEALASIAAVAQVEMVSKQEGQEFGNHIILKGGNVVTKGEYGCPVGTKITVEDLFYNTPVRYKFLKKDYTEAGYIEDVVTRIALVNQDIAITLINNGKTILHTNGGSDPRSIIYSIYGKEVSDNILDVDYEYEGMSIKGVIGNNVIAKTNRVNQLFFVNNRYVKDKTFTAATDQAYKEYLPSGKYGFVILNLKMNPEDVDVNVHPAKLEVRFQDEGTVFKAIYHAIKNVLETIEPKIAGGIDIDEEPTQEQLEEIEEKKKGFLAKFRKEKKITQEEQESEERLTAIINSRKMKFSDEPIQDEDDELEDEKEDFSEEVKSDSKEQTQEKIEQEESKEEVEDVEAADEEKSTEKSSEEIFNSVSSKFSKAISKTSDDRKRELIENAKRNIKKIGANLSQEETDEDLQKYIGTSTVDTKESEEIISKEEVVTDDIEKLDVSTTVEEVSEEDEVTGPEEYDIKPVDIDRILVKDDNKYNIDQTMAIDPVGISSNKETQVVDSLKKDALQETQIMDVVKLESKYNTQPIDTAQVIEDTKDTEEDSTNADKMIERENIDDTNIGQIEEKLIAQKLNSDMYDTQFVDTNAVREALNENTPLPKDFEEMYKKTFGVETWGARKEKEKEEKENDISASDTFSPASENENLFENESEEKVIPAYKYIGLLFDNYIVIEIKGEMYIVDSNVAQERIMLENLKQSYYSEEDKDSQMLLLPDVINLTKKQMFNSRENVDLFEKAGFKYEDFGENTIKLISVPAVCERLNTKDLFVKMLDSIEKIAITDVEEKEEKFIETIAKELSRENNFELTEENAQDVVNELLTFDKPFTNAGQPSAIKMTRIDLEKKFSRR